VGPACQRNKEKEKKKAAAVGCCGGKTGGPLGRRAGRGEGKFSLFCSFSNSCQTKLLNLNSNQTFSNFSQNFIIFLKVTEATKNHAKPNNDAQPLVFSILIKLSLIF
jgi:hypothetical protein